MQIRLAEDPLTNYETANHGESTDLRWIQSGDPRSELMLSLFREPLDYGLSVMLNGHPGRGQKVQDLVSTPPSVERQRAICPTTRVRAGNYTVPTFIIHGEHDNVAPFEPALKLYDELQRQGVKAGFLAVKNGRHVHDLRLKPGMAAWDEQVAPGYDFLFEALKN